jgi:hypothetical protein
MFELDPFAEEDGTVAGKGRKRTRLSSVWTYTSRSPTPDRKATPVEGAIEEPLPTPPRPAMMDEGCQTVEVDMDDAAEVLASFSRQSINIGSIPYQITNTLAELNAQVLSNSMPPPMAPTPIMQHNSLSVAIENLPHSPRLQPLSSEDLPLVSPLISRGLGFSSSRPILSLPPSDGEDSRNQLDSSLEVGLEDLYNASPRTLRDGGLSTTFSFAHFPASETNNRDSLRRVATDHFMAPELYGQLDEDTTALHSDNTDLTDDERFYVGKEKNGNDCGQNESPSSSSHIPPHTQYPDLDDSLQQSSEHLWGNGSSTVAYPEFDMPGPPRDETFASAPLSRSLSGQSRDQAVDLTEGSDKESHSEQEIDADGEDEVDDEVSNDEGQETMRNFRPHAPNDLLTGRHLDNGNRDLLQNLTARDDEMQASENESTDADEVSDELGYDEDPEDSEEERYYNPDVDQDDNYLDRHGNVTSGPGVLQGDGYEEDYASDGGIYDEEDEEMDHEESPDRPVRPSGPPVVIDLLSSDDEEEVPKPTATKPSSPRLQVASSSSSSSDDECEQSDSELIPSNVKPSSYDGANDAEESSDDQEPEIMGDSSNEGGRHSEDEMNDSVPPRNDIKMTSPLPGDVQIQEVVVMEEHIEVLVKTETVTIHRDIEDSVLPDEDSDLKLPAVDTVEDSEREPGRPSPDRKTAIDDDDVEDGDRKLKESSPDSKTTSDEVESSPKVVVKDLVIPMVVIEQEPSVQESLPNTKDNNVEDDMKDSVEATAADTEVTDAMDIDDVDVASPETNQDRIDKESPELEKATLQAITTEPAGEAPEDDFTPGNPEAIEAATVEETTTELADEAPEEEFTHVKSEISEEDTLPETATEPVGELLEEEFTHIETEAGEESLDENGEETIGETLEEEYAEIVAEAVEEAVEEVKEAHDHNKLGTDSDQSITPWRILKALGDGRETPHESQSFGQSHNTHSPTVSIKSNNDSPTRDIHELHNPHFTRSKGPALEVVKQHLRRRSHGLDGATDDGNMLQSSVASTKAGRTNQLPTPDDTQVSQTIPSAESSFTAAQISPNTITNSQKEIGHPTSQPKSSGSPQAEDMSKTTSSRVTRARGKVASIDSTEDKPSATPTSKVTPKLTEAPKHDGSSPKTTTTRGGSELSPDAVEITHTSPRRSHRRAKSTTSTVDVRDLRSRAVSTVDTKENFRPQTPVESSQVTRTGNNQVPPSFPAVVLDRRVSLPGHDASVELALSSLESRSKVHDLPTAPGADMRLKLSRHLRTQLSEFTALKVLRYHLNQKLDVLAVATTTPPEAQRARGGPRHYQIFFNITDPTIAPSAVIQVQVSRPYKSALPIVQVGDGILLRGFRVTSVRQGFALQSDQTGESSWAVFKTGDEIEVKGPPVEYGEEEKDHLSQMRLWYSTLDSTAIAKINRANADKGLGSPGGKA